MLGVVLCCLVNYWFSTDYFYRVIEVTTIPYISLLLLLLGEALALIFLYRLVKYRFFQYSLRTLMIFVTIFAVACSWFAVKMGQATRQKEAVKAFKKLGGDIAYDYQFDSWGQIISQNMEPMEAPCLRKILGVDFFHTVVYAKSIDDAPLRILKDLSGIRQLKLTDEEVNSQVTDAGLESLECLSQLQILDLGYSKVTDAGLEHLKGLTQLHRLVLNGTKVSYEGVDKLQKSLQHCEISYHY
jgi:hypothetical protein